MSKPLPGKSPASSRASAASAQTAALIASAHRRKEDSRERLLTAAFALFCEDGYAAVSVEDIAAAARVSRVTFYRHFTSKAELAVDLFRREVAVAMPRFVSILSQEFRDRNVVARWIGELFKADRSNRRLMRVFMQATADESFTQRAQELLAELIREFGRRIPAFAADPDHARTRRRWLEAWLLLYEILDQSNHAALDSGIATDPLVIEILADRFHAFVRQESPG